MTAKIPTIPKLALLFLLSSLCFSLQACTNKEPQEAQKILDLELRMVVSPEVEGLFERLKKTFEAQAPKLNNQQPIRISLMSVPALSAAEKIAAGIMKTELWLAPSSSLVRITNESIRNLGAPQKDCVRLFETPTVFVGKEKFSRAFGAENQILVAEELIATARHQKASKKDMGSRISLSHAMPKGSTTGAAALLHLSYLSLESGESVLHLEKVRSPSFMDRLREREALSSAYPSREDAFLSRMLHARDNRPHLMVTTEQQLALLDQSKADAKDRLVAFYPQEGSYWQAYQVCLSQADWVTAGHRIAAKSWLEFLSTPDVQKEFLKLGFRPSHLEIQDPGPLSAQQGILLSQPSKSFLPVDSAVFGAVLGAWSQARKPISVSLVMDTSGSMEGERLIAGKDFFRRIVAGLKKNDTVSLFSVATKVKEHFLLSKNQQATLRTIDQVRALGGSAAHDGIKRGIEVLSKPELDGFRKLLVVYTDGDDRNSKISFARLLDIVGTRASLHDIQVEIIAIENAEADHKDLKEVAQAANGVCTAEPLEHLETAFQNVLRTL